MPEIENQEAKLQNFIMEIEKIKESHPSLFGVENVKDLGLEEYKAWEDYKVLFKKFDGETSKSDIPQKNSLDQLMAEIEVQVQFVHKNLTGLKNKNRREFLAWMSNRLGAQINNLEILQDEDEEDRLQKVRNSISREKKNLLF